MSEAVSPDLIPRVAPALRWAPVLLAISLFALPYVLFSAFSNFAWYDDEGTILIWFRWLRDGNRMYDDIYNLYGPLFSAFYGLIYSVIGVPLTHSTGRLIAALFWLGSTICLASLCYRLTRSIPAAALSFVVTLFHLTPLTHTPGHPEEMCLLLLGLALLLTESIERRRDALVLACIGIAGMALALVKINIGVYAGGGGLLVLLCASPRSRGTRIAIWTIAFGLSLLPIAITAPLLEFHWARLYAIYATLTIGAALIVFLSTRWKPIVRSADWRIIVAGAVFIAVTAVGGMMAAGSSFLAILDAMLLQNAHFVRNWYLPAGIDTYDLFAPGLSFLAATAFVLTGSRPDMRDYRDRGIVALKATFVVVGLILLATPVALFCWLVPFCWLFIVPPTSDARHGLLPRTALGLIGAAMSMYAFPVAGSQVDISGLLPVAMLPVMAHDVLTRIDRDGRSRLPLFGAFCRAMTVTFLGLATLGGSWEYWRNEPLGLPGTQFIRVHPAQGEDLRWVTRQLASCASSYTVPGMPSFAFWTEHPSPTPVNLNSVLNFVSVQQQEAIVQALSMAPDLCVAYNPALSRFFDRGQIEKQPPLIRYLHSEFTSAAEHHGYIILRRRAPG